MRVGSITQIQLLKNFANTNYTVITSHFYSESADCNERYIQVKTTNSFSIHTYSKGAGSQEWIAMGFLA